MKNIETELSKWNEVKDLAGDERLTLGTYFTYQIRNTPRRLLCALSRYKFAAKLLGENKNILEIGCSEGMLTPILAEFASNVVAVDIDSIAIKEAVRAFGSEKITFLCDDFLGKKLGDFDGVVSGDVIEHIYPENEELFFKSICENLKDHGICIIITPNITSNQYASAFSKAGHINLYSWDRLKKVMDNYFHNVFIFSSNDEIVHTGFYPMAHYLIAVGISKKQ